MRMPRKYFSYRNIFIFFFAFAAIALLRNALHEFSGIKNLLEAIASEITRPIGVGVSVLATTAALLGSSYARTRSVPASEVMCHAASNADPASLCNRYFYKNRR
jgi:membrane protease YdiL (CAAX protease family)